MWKKTNVTAFFSANLVDNMLKRKLLTVNSSAVQRMAAAVCDILLTGAIFPLGLIFASQEYIRDRESVSTSF